MAWSPEGGADAAGQGCRRPRTRGLLWQRTTGGTYSGHEKVVQMLLDKGADVHVQGGRYGSALQMASAGGHEKVVQILNGSKLT